MYTYRISKKVYIDDLNGTGSALYGGRWNPKGLSLCYTSGSVSLAYLEFLIHNYHILSTATVCLAKIKVAKVENMLSYPKESLPFNWDSKTLITADTQNIGTEFLTESGQYILKVPSVIVPGEFNYLLNPLHSDHKHTHIEEIIDPLNFDTRLVNLRG